MKLCHSSRRELLWSLAKSDRPTSPAESFYENRPKKKPMNNCSRVHFKKLKSKRLTATKESSGDETTPIIAELLADGSKYSARTTSTIG